MEAPSSAVSSINLQFSTLRLPARCSLYVYDNAPRFDGDRNGDDARLDDENRFVIGPFDASHVGPPHAPRRRRRRAAVEGSDDGDGDGSIDAYVGTVFATEVGSSVTRHTRIGRLDSEE